MKTLEGFSRRAWLSVWVIVAYVLLLQGLHFVASVQAVGQLEREVTARARLAASAVLDAGDSSMREVIREWTRGGVPRRPTLPRAFFEQHGILSVEVLSPDGWGIDSRIGQAQDGSPRTHLDDLMRRRLQAGETLVDLSGADDDPVYAVATAWKPVLDSDARLVGIVAVDVGAESLALARRRMRWGAIIELASLLAFAALLALSMRWTLRPLRLLERTTRSGDSTLADDLAARDDTGFVIETYRRMIAQLQDKEQELRRLREVERHRADSLEELNASIVGSMVTGVLILDRSGGVRTTNAVARSVLGLADERTTGRPFADVLRHAPELVARLRACLEEGAVTTRDELRLNLPGIGRRDVGVSVSPLVDAAGARNGILCIFADVTEVKRLQEEVRMKESLAELGELSAGIAHEFRNALAAIMGFAKLLERRSDGDAREHATAIVSECSQLRRVVDDFLRFANPTRLVVESVDLARLFTELLDDTRARADAKSVRLAVAPGLPVVSGDETLLRRAFGNVLRNAVEASPESGEVQVTHEVAEREITVHVDDQGPGIPEAERERVFIPFFTRKESGTGLGLALVRKIAVHHGGRVVIDEAPRGGARVSLTLPVRPERDSKPVGGESLRPGRPAPMTRSRKVTNLPPLAAFIHSSGCLHA